MVKLAQNSIRSTELSIAYSPCYVVVLMQHNVIGLGEVGDFENETLKLLLNLN